jgi:tetratricopeptide (TPR) repeat protein
MKLLKIILLNLILVQSVFAINLDERRKKINNIIDEELNEVSRLNKQTGSRNPNHLLRMAELYLEKARLWREKENQDYLALPSEVRRKTNKIRYFATSTKYFKAANNLCLRLVKRFKNYKHISDVYYILGFNAKESGKMNTAQKYFNRANKKSSRSSITKVKSQISLAEIYYNKKQFRKAIPLYERALSKHKDKWWTKDSFNLAWCYFRANKYSQAISKMKEVFKKSSSKQYIDMRAPVERDIGLFFATAGRIEEGISFYKKIGINFTDQLLRIAVTMKGKGQFTRADKTLKYALKYEKNKDRYGEIYVEQLDLYSQFGRVDSHLVTAQKMYALYKKKKLTDNQLKKLKFHAGKHGAILQKQVASKTYRRLKKKRRAKANAANAYFDILIGLDGNNAPEYRFYQGETAFVIGSYAESLKYYNESFDASVTLKKNKFKTQAMEGILSSLGQRRLSKKTKENYYVPVYEKYLKNYPNGKRANSIYQKLFKVYFDRNQLKEARGVLDRFVKVYPNDWKTQEAMIANLMEKARKKKENDKIRAWIGQIDAGKYKVSKRYANKLRELLTTMQIEDVQMQLKKGNKKEALVGYHQVLKDPHSTKKSKINAKYNLAALYYEMGATENAFEWSVKAINEMRVSDTKQFSDSFLTISSFLFTRLEFERSAQLSKRIVQKLCKSKTRKKSIAFKNSAYIYLAEGNHKEAKEMIKLGQNCKIPRTYIDNIRFELLKDYLGQKSWNNAEEQVNILATRKKNRPKLIAPLDKLENFHKSFGNANKANALNKTKWLYYYQANKAKMDIPLEALDIIAEIDLRRLKNTQTRILSTKLQFPFQVFQKKAGYIRKWLDRMIVDSNRLQKIGSGLGIVKAYSMLIKTHEQLATNFESFKPAKLTEQEKANINTFYKQMKAQASELRKTAQELKRDVWKTIEQNQILSAANNEVLPNNYGIAIRYWYPDRGVIMDRGGKR